MVTLSPGLNKKAALEAAFLFLSQLGSHALVYMERSGEATRPVRFR